VFSDDPASPLTINLNGTGLECRLSVAPPSLNFGNVTVGTTNTLTFTLSNSGNTNCTVDSMRIVGSGHFSLSTSGPFSVAPTNSVDVSVDYRPTAADTIIILNGQLKGTGKPTQVP
jgi:hypothetical protein